MTTTGPRRDPRADHLITPENAALLVIDDQPSQVAAVRSMDRHLLLKNMVSTAKTAKTFGLPIVRSTINLRCGGAKHRATETDLLRAVDGGLHGIPALDALREGFEVYPVVDAIGRVSRPSRK